MFGLRHWSFNGEIRIESCIGFPVSAFYLLYCRKLISKYKKGLINSCSLLTILSHFSYFIKYLNCYRIELNSTCKKRFGFCSLQPYNPAWNGGGSCCIYIEVMEVFFWAFVLLKHLHKRESQEWYSLEVSYLIEA